MLDPNQLSKLRFGMTDVPQLGGQPGTYEEKWSQWLLEKSFFREFVYRNPRGKKKGDELADAVVLFGDVALMAQVKAQHGKAAADQWAFEAISKAFKQLKATHQTLNADITRLRNDVYGEVEFRDADFPNQIGLIVLGHESAPYVAAELVPEILTASFPVHVFSLNDFRMIVNRFDTAGDLITFLEWRGDTSRTEKLFVQDELGNIERLLPHLPAVLKRFLPDTSEEILDKTYRAMAATARGEVEQSPEWKYGMAIDDMIAHAHDVDPSLKWSRGGERSAVTVAQFLGWFTRDRRIKLGRRVLGICEAAASDGKAHWFQHRKPSRGTCVFLSSPQARQERLKFLRYLVAYAQVHYGLKQCLGVATDPIGKGRSYDFILARGLPAPAVVEQLRKMENPFQQEEGPL